MSLEGLTGLVDRITAWADRLQRNHSVLGFPYAVIKKYEDDAGGRQAALITYYGFLSTFPLLLLGVAILSRVLADHPDLRQRLVTAIVPEALQSTVEHSLATLPTSTIPFAVGLIGLLFSGTGVVFSAYQTLNHVAAVRYRLRAGFLLPVPPGARRAGDAAARGAGDGCAHRRGHRAARPARTRTGGRCARVSAGRLDCAAAGGQVAAGAARPGPGPVAGSVLGAVAVTVVLNAGPPLLARLVTKAGPVYGSFATVAGMFALLYLVGQALVYAAEVAAVRYARLWPRALDVDHPTAADAPRAGPAGPRAGTHPRRPR